MRIHMKKGLRICWMIALLCLFRPAQGQFAEDFFTLNYSYNTPVEFERTTGMNYGQSDIGLDFKYPLSIGAGSNLFYIQGGYDFSRITNDRTDVLEFDIHGILINPAVLLFSKDYKWSHYIGMHTFLSSDLKEVTDAHWQSGLTYVASLIKSPELVYNFGIYYNDAPFGEWLFPLIGVDWQVNDKIYLSTTLLVSLLVDYELAERYHIGLSIASSGKSFVLSDFLGEKDSYITSISEDFPYTNFRTQIYLDYYAWEQGVFYIRLGIEAPREYRHERSDHSIITTSPYTGRIHVGPTFDVGFAYRISRFDF